MARSFANAKLVLGSISNAISRRGYATQGAVSAAAKAGGERSGGVMMNTRADEAIGSAAQERAAWGPDPKTGYYRPENSEEEIDVAELRAMLLRRKD